LSVLDPDLASTEVSNRLLGRPFGLALRRVNAAGALAAR
jgi:hypothetical protein